jgi:hypothetical protein
MRGIATSATPRIRLDKNKISMRFGLGRDCLRTGITTTIKTVTPGELHKRRGLPPMKLTLLRGLGWEVMNVES